MAGQSPLVVRWFSQLFSAQWENSIHSFPCLMIPEAIAKDRGYSSFCLLDKPISTAHGKTRMSNLKFAFASVFLSSFTSIFCDIFPDRIKTIAIPHFFYWIILHFFSWLFYSFPKKNNIVFYSHLLLTSRQLESRCSTTCKPLRRNSACTTPGLGWVCWKIRSKRPSIVRRRPDGRCSTAMTRWGVWFRMGSEMVEL